MTVVIIILVFVALVIIGVLVNRAKDKALRSAPHGAVRVESLKAREVNRTVAQYAKAGWTAGEQTSAKSFGSQARVTITFRKA